MTTDKIRCGLLGGQERDLPVLGELHKRAEVEIAFLYDPDPTSVGMEIAEILGIERARSTGDLAAYRSLDYVVVPEPREQFDVEVRALSRTGARVLTPSEAIDLLCPSARPPAAKKAARESEEGFSIDDALAAFERLFDRERLLEFLLDVAVQAAGAEAGSIMLYSEEADELYIVYASGLSERVVRNTRQKLGEGIAGVVARERKAKLIRRSPDQTISSIDRDRSDIHSAISVPLVYDDRLLGVLNVSSSASGPELTRASLSRLERLSARISRVLSESLKLQETRARHQEMSLRQSVGELSERTIPPGAKFSVISNYLGELLGAETVEIFVGTHEGDWLVLGGSNRRLSSRAEYVRCDRGALARSFLERRTVILSESADPADPSAPVTSVVFAPLHLGKTVGVMMLEFSERHRLDEFLAIKDSVALELSRFISSERRERRLRRELSALAKVSNGAPLLLTCRTLQDLCDYLARLIVDTLECERASVRVQGTRAGSGKVARYDNTGERPEAWLDEDEERFLKLKKTGEAFLYNSVTAPVDDEVPGYHSLIAVPIRVENAFHGGVIAYDRRAGGDLDDASFTDLDRSVLDQILLIAAPVIRSLSQAEEGPGTPGAPSYDVVLKGNTQRLMKVVDTEMARADRYHHSFSLVVFKVKPLQVLFESDSARALSLVDEVTKGIHTRTRKTDFGTWVRRDTFAMLSLEGTKRVKFLVSRLMLYLLKDFSTSSDAPVSRSDFLVGQSVYPGVSRTPEAMLQEAEAAACPQGEE